MERLISRPLRAKYNQRISSALVGLLVHVILEFSSLDLASQFQVSFKDDML